MFADINIGKCRMQNFVNERVILEATIADSRKPNK